MHVGSPAMCKIWILASAILNILQYVQAQSTQNAAARTFYQNLRRKTLAEVQGRSRYNIERRRQGYIASRRQSPQRLIVRGRPIPGIVPQRNPYLHRVIRPAVIPARKYILPPKRYQPVIPGRIMVAPAMKRTHPIVPRIYMRPRIVHAPVRPVVRYSFPVKRPLIQRIQRPALLSRRAPPRLRYQIPSRFTSPQRARAQLRYAQSRIPLYRRVARPQMLIKLKYPIPSKVRGILPYQQRYGVNRPINVLKGRLHPPVRRIFAPPKPRGFLPSYSQAKSAREKLRNAILWKKYLKAEHNPYASQIARRISVQALKRGPVSRRPYPISVISRLNRIQAYKRRFPMVVNPLRRQTQTSFNTQYSTSGTSSNSGTNSNTVLKGPGQTQTNNHVKVTQNTGVRRILKPFGYPMARSFKPRPQKLYIRQDGPSAKARANAKAKASAGVGASAGSSSSSGKAARPAKNIPPQNRGSGGGSGFGYGAGYGWGSTGGGGFGYGGGGGNGFPGIPFPYGFGGFPYIPGNGGQSNAQSGNKIKNPAEKQKKKPPVASAMQNGRKVTSAFKPGLLQKKPLRPPLQRNKYVPNKINYSKQGLSPKPGKAALNIKYFTTARRNYNRGALQGNYK